jgi:hypothetical protein
MKTYKDYTEIATAVMIDIVSGYSQTMRDEIINRVAHALYSAYRCGRTDIRDEIAGMVSSCLDRDPSLIKLQNEIEVKQ